MSSSGEAALTLISNERPVGGSCVVDKVKVVAIVDKITVTCDKWIDPENMIPLSYSFFGERDS